MIKKLHVTANEINDKIQAKGFLKIDRVQHSIALLIL